MADNPDMPIETAPTARKKMPAKIVSLHDRGAIYQGSFVRKSARDRNPISRPTEPGCKCRCQQGPPHRRGRHVRGVRFHPSRGTLEDAPVFIVELTYSGIVQVSGVPEDDVKPIVLIEGPRHLFPFARTIISNAVRDGGFPPLLINPIDFAALFIEQHVDSDGLILNPRLLASRPDRFI